MKTEKLIDKLSDLMDPKATEDKKHLKKLRKVIKELKEKQKKLQKKLDESDDADEQRRLDHTLKVIRAQRSKGAETYKALKQSMEERKKVR